MTLTPRGIVRSTGPRPILVAHRRAGDAPRWCDEFESGLRPVSFSVCRAYTRRDAVRRVERGGLAAAVLLADDREIDALSVLRTIRSIDQVLPCWLLMQDVTRHSLETALLLRATSVMEYPAAAAQLIRAVRNALIRNS